jgi:hypothetical protein
MSNEYLALNPAICNPPAPAGGGSTIVEVFQRAEQKAQRRRPFPQVLVDVRFS